MQFGWKKTILFSLIPVVALFAVLEIGARVYEAFVPPLPVDYGWGFTGNSRLFVPASTGMGILVTAPSKEVSFQKERFKAEKPAGVFRVFMFGGSSVNYIQYQLKELAAQLEEEWGGRLRFEIIDVGGQAYGTHRLVPIVGEVMAYQPDLVLVYSGHNEFEEADQLILAQPERAQFQKRVYAFALTRVIRDFFARRQMAKLRAAKDQAEIAHNNKIIANPEADYMSGFHKQYTLEEIEERMAAYRRNLEMMASICALHEVPIVLGTVASNWWKPDLANDEDELRVRALYEAGKLEAGMALAREKLRTGKRHQASDAENEIIREVAVATQARLVDVLGAVREAEPDGIPGQTLFSDRCHLNGEGNEILVAQYAQAIREAAREAAGPPDAQNSP